MTSSTDRGASPTGTSGSGVDLDDKDWTWVLQRACPGCGFLREKAACWPAVCVRADAGVRPGPLVWSPLEYACHVRDVCQVFGYLVNLMRSQVDPVFESWDQDDAAIADDYGSQEAVAVGVELFVAAEAAASAFEAVGPGQWQRTGRRADGFGFTIESLGQYFLHDVIHHLHDVRG